MKNKKNDVAVIGIIIGIVAITISVIIWLFAEKMHSFITQPANTQSRSVSYLDTDNIVKTELVTDETLNWKTCAYSDLGISLKYPPDELITLDYFGDGDDYVLPGFATAIKFNKESDGLDEWAISEKNAKELYATSSCDILKDKAEKEIAIYGNRDNFYLPSLFDKPNLCGVINVDNGVIFYVIGKDHGFETLPLIDAGLLIIENDRAIVVNGLLSNKINVELKNWTDTYLKNNPGEILFGNSEFRKILPLANNKIDELLQNPSLAMNANLELLQKIASSITTIKQ